MLGIAFRSQTECRMLKGVFECEYTADVGMPLLTPMMTCFLLESQFLCRKRRPTGNVSLADMT